MDARREYQDYHEHVDRLVARLDRDEALRLAVGGEFVAVGELEHRLLRALDLTDGQLVVDVGCGSGRLAAALAPSPGIRYIGCDIEPRLLRYAEELSRRPDWSFICSDGRTVPCPDGEADFVCFFSVFTHLPHEATFRYLQGASRALKPGGRVVCSFLEFRIGSHWSVFEHSLAGAENDWGRHLNQFISRDGLRAWAAYAGLEIWRIYDGDRPHIPIPQEIVWDSGVRMTGMGNLGQSVAVLVKPA